MKLKTSACSTGHGTGVTPPGELRRLLESRTSMFIGRADLGAVGRVERPSPVRAPRGPALLDRQGYFRKKRQAELERRRRNLLELAAWV